jgi:hypothetical protein
LAPRDRRASEGLMVERQPPIDVSRIPFALLLVALGQTHARQAFAEGPQAADDSWRVRSGGRLTVDGGLVVGIPAALSTGLTTGVGGGVMFGGGLFAFGARASWSTATESSIVWTVTRSDLRLRAAGAIQHTAGRGRLALRLAVGPTVVHETRTRNQGMRAGLTGSDLTTSAFVALPTADLEGVIEVHIAGPWLLTMSGGPSLLIADGNLTRGWNAALGMGWQR